MVVQVAFRGEFLVALVTSIRPGTSVGVFMALLQGELIVSTYDMHTCVGRLG